MIVKVKDKGLRLNLTAETIKDQMPIEKLVWVDKLQEWDDLLVYLQKKYE